MKIIIAGAGEVGTHLAKMLSNEDQDIILIDSDQESLDLIDNNYNLMTYNGSTSGRGPVHSRNPLRNTKYNVMRHSQAVRREMHSGQNRQF